MDVSESLSAPPALSAVNKLMVMHQLLDALQADPAMVENFRQAVSIKQHLETVMAAVVAAVDAVRRSSADLPDDAAATSDSSRSVAPTAPAGQEKEMDMRSMNALARARREYTSRGERLWFLCSVNKTSGSVAMALVNGTSYDAYMLHELQRNLEQVGSCKVLAKPMRLGVTLS